MKGFLSFAAMLAMATLLLFFGAALEGNNHELEKTKNELIKAEEANKERTLLENNTDRIIWVKLMAQVAKENYNVAGAQNEINSGLEGYLKGKTKVTSLSHEEKSEVTTEQLNANSSVMILKTEAGTYAEYVYTSTPLKNTLISAKLGNDIVSYFEIPIGHITRIFVPA